MIEKVREYAGLSDIMVFTGSLPPGCPADFYKTLIEAAEGKCRCVLDAEGEKLARGMEAKPFLIKPTQYEFELRVGRKLDSVQDIEEAALECVAEGIGIVAVEHRWRRRVHHRRQGEPVCAGAGCRRCARRSAPATAWR